MAITAKRLLLGLSLALLGIAPFFGAHRDALAQPIKEAEKIAANMVFMDNPTEERLKKLQGEFRQIFFGP